VRREHQVDAAPSREHLRRLVAAGAGIQAIARRYGLHRDSLYDILSGRRARVYTSTERVILAVTLREVAWGGRVGLVRRVRALQAIGWPQRAIAAAAGVSLPTISYLAQDRLVGAWGRVDAGVRAAYERLHMTPGPSQASRDLARRRGWAPPLAWDDIDDPQEKPAPRWSPRRGDGDPYIDPVAVAEAVAGRRVRLTPAEREAAVRVARARGATWDELMRLGSTETIRRVLRDTTEAR